VIVAVDGSENAKRAFDVALGIAKDSKADLIVLNVVPPVQMVAFPSIGADPYPQGMESYYADAQKSGSKLVGEMVDVAKNGSVSASGIVERTTTSIVESILDKADSEKADLIVVGTRGLGGFKKLVLGSVSSGLVSHAGCNVLVVR
jgi:nucleotide-binding universal stress UspA family protein